MAHIPPPLVGGPRDGSGTRVRLTPLKHRWPAGPRRSRPQPVRHPAGWPGAAPGWRSAGQATPQTMAASARLNTYHDQPPTWARMKSTTAPNRSRSMTLPTAPPAMAPSAAPVSAESARRSHRASATTITQRQHRQHHPAPGAQPVQQPERDPAVPHHDEIEHRQQTDAPNLRQPQPVQHPVLARLIGREHQQRNDDAQQRVTIAPHAAARQTRPDSTASAQRAHSAGCAGLLAHFRQHPPAARAFVAGGRLNTYGSDI